MQPLLITPLFPPQTGGIQTYLHGICQILPAAPRVLAVAYPGLDSDRLDRELGYSVQRVPYAPGRTPWDIWRAGDRAAADATVVLWGTLRLAALVGMTHPSLRRLPWGIFCYGKELTTPAGGLYQALERRALTRAGAVFAISQFAAERSIERGALEARVRIIRPAIAKRFLDVPRDEERVAAWRRLHQIGAGPVLLTLGRLVLRKGVDQVIRALPAILTRYPGATYLVGGSGPAEPDLRALVRELGLQEHVRFLGHVAPDDTLACYDCADLFLMPSRVLPSGDSEGFGIVLLEAQARGVPVVAGVSGGMGDAVAPGCGLLVDGESVEQVAAAALQVLGLPEHGRCWGRQARDYVAQELTEEQQREQMRRCLDELERTHDR